jgi:hypothetical protein
MNSVKTSKIRMKRQDPAPNRKQVSRDKKFRVPTQVVLGTVLIILNSAFFVRGAAGAVHILGGGLHVGA